MNTRILKERTKILNYIFIEPIVNIIESYAMSNCYKCNNYSNYEDYFICIICKNEFCSVHTQNCSECEDVYCSECQDDYLTLCNNAYCDRFNCRNCTYTYRYDEFWNEFGIICIYCTKENDDSDN